MRRDSHADPDVAARLADLAGEESGMRLPALKRRLIVDDAVRVARLGQRRAASPAPAPFGLPAYAGLAVMVLALLLVGSGYFYTPGLVRTASHPPLASTDPVTVRVSQEGGDVVLEWQDGARASYTVKQAASAKEVREVAGIQIQGHRYVDRTPSDSRIVYYLVE